MTVVLVRPARIMPSARPFASVPDFNPNINRNAKSVFGKGRAESQNSENALRLSRLRAIQQTNLHRRAADNVPVRNTATRVMLGDPRPGFSAQDEYERKHGGAEAAVPERDAAEIRKLYFGGATVSEIAERTNLPPKSILALIRKGAGPTKLREASSNGRRA